MTDNHKEIREALNKILPTHYELIINSKTDKTERWSVNTEKEYHEIRSDDEKSEEKSEKAE